MKAAPETLKDIRKGRTVAAVARGAGMTHEVAADTLSGLRCPRLDTAARLAEALGVSLDRFARAWAETRRRRREREDARAAAQEAIRAFGKDSS